MNHYVRMALWLTVGLREMNSMRCIAYRLMVATRDASFNIFGREAGRKPDLDYMNYYQQMKAALQMNFAFALFTETTPQA